MAQLFHYQTENGNFGDDLNLWFWDHAVPGWQDMDPDLTIFGIGTVLNVTNLARAKRSLVLGSGTGYGPPPAAEDLARADIRAVRGPRTAARLGCDPGLAVADPAILLPRMDLPFLRDLKPGTGGAIFVPHHHSMQLGIDWQSLCASACLALQSPHEAPETVIRRLAEARLVLAESMHAAIIADAFRVPWVPVRFNPGFNLFKWGDWGDSLGIEVQPLDLLDLPRRLLNLSERLRAMRRPKPPAGQARGPGASNASSGIRQIERFAQRIDRLRPVLMPYIGMRLRQAARRNPQLSDQENLTKAQDRLIGIFTNLRQNPL